MAQHPLRRWRFENDLTLDDAAEKLSISASAISLLERGKRGITVATAKRIAAATEGAVKIEDFANN